MTSSFTILFQDFLLFLLTLLACELETIIVLINGKKNDGTSKTVAYKRYCSVIRLKRKKSVILTLRLGTGMIAVRDVISIKMMSII